MKTNLLIKIALPVALLMSITSFAQTTTAECDATALKGDLKPLLKPEFKYDSSKTTRFSYSSKKQIKEIEVPLFMGEKYRFLFNTAGLPKDIKVEIYSKAHDNSKRKLLYALEQEEGKTTYTFEPTKSRKMYINYTIPESTEEELRGCMVFLLGYKL